MRASKTGAVPAILTVLVLLAIIAGAITFFLNTQYTKAAPDRIKVGNPVQPVSVGAIAECLASRGAKMYGAYWCPHCQNQKSAFGEFFKYIPYVECDPKGENPDPGACKAAGIQGYPTWVIGGVQYPGEKSVEELGKIAGCYP